MRNRWEFLQQTQGDVWVFRTASHHTPLLEDFVLQFWPWFPNQSSLVHIFVH